MRTTVKDVDYSWCYISTPATEQTKEKKVSYSRCSMCDEHYVGCPDDCMIDYE